MTHWTLRKLLAVGFAGPVTLILVLAGTFFFSLARIDGYVGGIVNDNVPGLTLSNQVGTEALLYRAATLRHIMSGDPTEMKTLEADCTAREQQLVKMLQAYDKTIHTAEDRAVYERVMPAWEAYMAFAGEARRHSASGDKARSQELVRTSGSQSIAAFQTALQAMVGYNERSAAASATGIAATMAATRSLATIVSLGAVLVSVGAAGYITRSVNGTLRRVSTALDDSSAQVTAAAGQVASTSQSLAEGASEQAASLEETSASIEELSSMTKRNSESTRQTKELSNQTRLAADVCATDMQAMNTAMDDIKSSSSDISKIIKTIDEIAFQTNILALNAAVEAARAGEAGMGFAVVAEEVRNLAQRSAQSARETADKIAVAITKSEHGVRISGKVAGSLTEILDKARKVDGLLAEIATASNEQSQGIGQVNSTVSQMDKVTQSTASNAEETAAAAEELSAQAVAMRESVADLRRLIDGGSFIAERSATRGARPSTTRPAKAALSAALRRPALSAEPASRHDDELNFADVDSTPGGGDIAPSQDRNGHANVRLPGRRNGDS